MLSDLSHFPGLVAGVFIHSSHYLVFMLWADARGILGGAAYAVEVPGALRRARCITLLAGR